MAFGLGLNIGLPRKGFALLMWVFNWTRMSGCLPFPFIVVLLLSMLQIILNSKVFKLTFFTRAFEREI